MQRINSVKRSDIIPKVVFICTTALFALAFQTSIVADSEPPVLRNMTLKDAIRLALEHNRFILDAHSDRVVKHFSLQVAEDRWHPRVSLKPFVSRDREDRIAGASAEVILRVQTGGQFTIQWDETLSHNFEDSRKQTLRFSQPLLKGAWKEIDSAPVRQARLEDQINALGFTGAVSDLVERVIGSYRSLIGATRQVQISITSLSRARQQLEATRSLIEAGRVAEREALHSEVTIANRKLALVRARNRLDAANAELVAILNLSPANRVNPIGRLEAEHGQGETTLRLEEVLQSRIDYKQAELRLDIAHIKLSLARNNLLPDVSLAVETTREDPGRRTDSSVRLDAHIPLNDRSTELEHLRAQNELEKAQRGLIGLRDLIGIELQQTINDVEVGFQLTQLALKARELAEENLEIEKKKFAQGLSSSFEVAASEDELVRAEQDQVETTLSWLDALTRFDRVSGHTLERWGIGLEMFGR
ncbi:MAG: TolC family protein [Gammaproteobacteria bacterium]|nr:TolC family protein [Gammaproteobacteria bacterium]